jgi:hypothetical protein
MVIGLIEGMREAPLTFPTPNGGCHPLWVLGTLAWNECMFIQEWVEGEPNRLADWETAFGIGSEPVAAADSYPAFDEVLAMAHEVRRHTSELFESLSEEDLDRPSYAPQDRQAQFGTVGECFLMLALKWTMHRGNVADAMRAAAFTPLTALRS